MEVCKSKLFIILIGTVSLLLLGACAEESDSSNGSSTDELDNQAEDGEASNFPRTVTHTEGELTLEEKPERVALADVNIIDYYLLIDELPIGARIDTIDRSQALKELIDEHDPDESITSIGGKVNMETLIGLEPDLIIISERKKDNYERFSKVADTIVLDGSTDRTIRLQQLGDIFGKEEIVEEIIDDMEALKAETKEKIEERSDETVLFLRANGKDFTVLTPEENGLLYEKVGLKTAGEFDDIGQVTVEAISEADPDHIFVMEARRQMDPDNIGALIEVWEDNAVWNNLEAVQNDQLYMLDSLVADDFFTGWELELEAIQENLGDG